MLRLIDVRGRDTQGLAAMLPVPTRLSEDLHDRVARVVEQVRRRGDAAVRELSASFGDEVPEQFSVSATEIEKATVTVGEELMSAMREAADQIRSFHRSRMPSGDVFRSGGIEVETRFVPVRKAGCYVPGGRAAYPSTVLMTAIPARVAGVDEVVVCVPPGSGGKVPAVTLAACAVAGVDAVFAIGGAQAVAAMAFGTETVPAVDVVVGPGNRWVAEAKRQVAGVVGVPAAYAGPSEIVVVADDSAPPLWVAVDLAVQAEHGPDGMAWLVTWDESVSSRVAEELAAVVRDSPRRAEIESTLAHNGVAVLVDGPEQALAVVEAVAPEHLQLMTRDASDLAERVRNAGAVFCGNHAPAALGDYLAGPSHVLPTDRSARFAQALTVGDFLKEVHVVRCSPDELRRRASSLTALARAEGLLTHAMAVDVRTVGGAPGDEAGPTGGAG